MVIGCILSISNRLVTGQEYLFEAKAAVSGDCCFLSRNQSCYLRLSWAVNIEILGEHICLVSTAAGCNTIAQ